MSNIRKGSMHLAISILIGGASTRFGSDKGLFQISGKPLISYELETLGKLNYDIFLVAHSKKQVQDYLDKIEIERVMAFIVDDYTLLENKDIKTPLLGLYSAFKELNELGYEKTFVLPCDTPLIQKNVIEFLVKASRDYDCCIPQWNNRLFEPLIAIYPIKKAFERSKEILKANLFKLTNLLDKNWKINYVSIENFIQPLDPQLLSFLNVNGHSDIEIIKTRFKLSLP
ncbi:MAG: molybdenum cofactor guanylyltransferase [Candidatus Thorarchaeota archaeon]